MVTFTTLIALLACAGVYLGWRLSAAQARVKSSRVVRPWWPFLTYLFFGCAAAVCVDLFVLGDEHPFVLTGQIIPIIAFTLVFTALVHRPRE